MKHFDRDGNPVAFEWWCLLMEKDEYRRVGSDRVEDVWISTVWLGIDHNLFGHGPPILFETMVFGGPHDSEMYRYSTWEQAAVGHHQVVEKIREEYAQC